MFKAWVRLQILKLVMSDASLHHRALEEAAERADFVFTGKVAAPEPRQGTQNKG